MLKVTPEQLVAMSGSVARTADQVSGAHSSLSNQLRPLYTADWSGAAAAQFASLYTQFDTHAKQMNDALAGIGRLLHGAGTNYDLAEKQIAASFRS